MRSKVNLKDKSKRGHNSVKIRSIVMGLGTRRGTLALKLKFLSLYQRRVSYKTREFSILAVI